MLRETGERQVKNRLVDVDFDHRMRYEFAASLSKEGFHIADIGCGIGYGSYTLACSTGCASVTGIDIAEEAISYAKTYYQHPKIIFSVDDITLNQSEYREKFDLITAFEVVEHVPNSLEFLRCISQMLAVNGIVVFTTPNEDVIPYSPEMFKFHVKHYTEKELSNLLGAAGLEVIYRFSQNGTVIYGFPGNAFHMLVCRKNGSTVVPSKGTALNNTPLNQAMACFERIDWLLEHVPQENTGTLMAQLKNQLYDMNPFRQELISRKDAYLRKYMPQTCRDNPNFVDPIEELSPGDVVSQAFICHKPGLCGIEILPALYGTEFTGLLIAILYDDKNSPCAMGTFSQVYDNQELLLSFAPYMTSKGKTFRLELSLAELSADSRISFYKTGEQPDCHLFRNEVQIPFTLTYKLLFY